MKKLILASVISVSALPTFAADVTPLFDIYAGVGSWSSEYSGEVGAQNSTATLEELGLEDQDNVYFYAAFEHAVPIIPAVRLELIDLSTSGSERLEREFVLENESFEGGRTVDTDLDLSFTDLTLYWEIAMVDFGLTFRQFDLEASVLSEPQGEFTSEIAESASVSGTIPMIYVQAKVPFPTTGIYVTGSGQMLSIADVSIIDFRGGLGYDIEVGPTKMGLELGMRQFELDLGEEEDITGVIDLSGMYFGLNLKF